MKDSFLYGVLTTYNFLAHLEILRDSIPFNQTQFPLCSSPTILSNLPNLLSVANCSSTAYIKLPRTQQALIESQNSGRSLITLLEQMTG